jgi:hypothetical protein
MKFAIAKIFRPSWLDDFILLMIYLLELRYLIRRSIFLVDISENGIKYFSYLYIVSYYSRNNFIDFFVFLYYLRESILVESISDLYSKLLLESYRNRFSVPDLKKWRNIVPFYFSVKKVIKRYLGHSTLCTIIIFNAVHI